MMMPQGAPPRDQLKEANSDGSEDDESSNASAHGEDVEIAREKAETRAFVRRCPCPQEARVLAWLEDAVGPEPGKLDRTQRPLQTVLQALDLHTDALSNFSYESFHSLWHAAGQYPDAAVQRSVGQDLHAKGGIGLDATSCRTLNPKP